MSKFIDSAGSEVGRKYYNIEDIDSRSFGKRMLNVFDPRPSHSWLETCEENGMYFNARKFTDDKYETLMDKFRDLLTGNRG